MFIIRGLGDDFMNSQEADFEVPTWNQIYNLLLKTATRILNDNFKPNLVVGVSRGGLIPARILSDLLSIQDLAVVSVKSYEYFQEAHFPSLIQNVSTAVENKRALVVDEVVDSGKSLKLVKAHLMNKGANAVQTATLYFKPHSAFIPDFYEKKTRNWVVFPWEINETIEAIYRTHETNPVQAEADLATLNAAGVPKRLISYFMKSFSKKGKIC
jgi:hypoxanthine phosphoribosyltransferase